MDVCSAAQTSIAGPHYPAHSDKERDTGQQIDSDCLGHISCSGFTHVSFAEVMDDSHQYSVAVARLVVPPPHPSICILYRCASCLCVCASSATYITHNAELQLTLVAHITWSETECNIQYSRDVDDLSWPADVRHTARYTTHKIQSHLGCGNVSSAPLLCYSGVEMFCSSMYTCQPKGLWSAHIVQLQQAFTFF